MKLSKSLFEALASHLTPITRALIKQSTFIDRLLTLSQSEDKITVEFSCQILASLSRFTLAKDVISDGLETITGLFAFDDPGRVSKVGCGFKSLGKRLLIIPDQDIKMHTLQTLINLSNDFTLATSVADFSGEIVAFCLRNLQSQFSIIQNLSMELVFLLCYESQFFAQFLQCDGKNQIMSILLNPNLEQLHSQAIKILTHIWVKNSAALIDDGSIEKVVSAVLKATGNSKLKIGILNSKLRNFI